MALRPFAHLTFTSSHVCFAFYTGQLLWARGRCYHQLPSPLCAPGFSFSPASIFFFRFICLFLNPRSSFSSRVTHARFCTHRANPVIWTIWLILSTYVRLSTELLVLFFSVCSIPAFSLLFSFPYTSPCSLLRLSLLLNHAHTHSERLSLCPQCLASAPRASFPAQTGVALQGAGSVTGTTTALMAQMRYRSHFNFWWNFLV